VPVSSGIPIRGTDPVPAYPAAGSLPASPRTGRPFFPDSPPDEPPTKAKHREQSVHTVRQLIDTIAIPRLTLAVEREKGAMASKSLVFDGDLCRIGTHSSNDLVLADPAVSRFHCRLVREDGGWRVRDTGSLNGTRLDGVRIRDADLATTPEGSVISLGDSIVRVRQAAAEREAFVPMMPSFGALTGTSMAMRKLFGMLEKVAQSDINVLIEGESGTGKELVATEIVQRGTRSDKPFVIVDCGAISPNLVESELFGHVRGSFTGADRDRVGAFEAADGGTVFLDEIGELPLELQPKLLRALEAREIRRVGETRARKVNVRVVSATNRDLEREVNKARFREDLYFRLAVIQVHVPSLRERLDDLPILIRHFLMQLNCPDEERLFPPTVLQEMSKHDWPGNVRELRNYVERTVVLQMASPTSRRSAPSSPALATQNVDIRVPFKLAKDAAVDTFERGYLGALLEACNGNMSKAARTAGMDRMYLHRLVQKHGLRGGGNSGGGNSGGGGNAGGAGPAPSGA
jgi:DNA-binding NtrC family response regulator